VYPSVKCPRCGTVHQFGDWAPMLDRALEDGCRPRSRGTIAERVRELRVIEWWLQQYVEHNHRKLGFIEVEGPFDAGPDFIVILKNGRRVETEVEVRWKNYVQHKHHTNPRFAKVGIIIALESDNPSPEIRKLLPKKLIRVDKRDFTKWYRAAARAYARKKEKERPARVAMAKIRNVAGEFHSRYVSSCGDKERDMAVCPDCDTCPYFGEPGEASQTFLELAAKFLRWHGVKDVRRLKLADIKPGDFDRFLDSQINSFNL
jgi:hypothetical protein